LLLRNLIFTILQPGLVAGLFPYLILGSRVKQIFSQYFGLPQYFGSIIFFIGLIIMIKTILQFALEGEGTLSPADPTRRLVVRGLYQYSRNPMYIGVMAMLIGEAVFFEGGGLWLYLLFVGIAFNIFILLVEEPRLKRDFGEEYEQYKQKVRRWL
ncbi:MAG TPA: isoprenylcysteine carboxylmethyltransferase family protein, partial [Saprospiraceae bacterium]|nr:isoprenylcysteine carboxylmethyltransferase family protein [Saprospiraceae bacterium]